MADERVPGRLTMSPAEMVQQLIFERRSIRRYKHQPLPEAWIEAMLACALQAPSPSNSQPVRYVRIQSPGMLESLRQGLSSGRAKLMARHKVAGAPARLRNWINAYHRYARVMFSAPVLLAVGVDPETQGFARRLAAAGLQPPRGHAGGELEIALGMALQNLILKAQSLGVGSCILTAPLVFIEDVEERLGLERMAIKCFVTLGIADETPQAPERLALADVVRVI